MTGFTDDDRTWMKRAIRLAEKGRGSTRPNPMVGAVIVKNGKVISEGYHRRPGEDHAEIAAIKNSPVPVRGSTMYVSLEPCTFTGRTPPCSHAIIEAGLGKVIIGALDPNPKVKGSGIMQLKEAGIDVLHGLYDKEVRYQNEIFFKNMEEDMPFVCAKIASSLDGKLAAADAGSRWITGPVSRKAVQDLRREYGCVLTGINTVLADDPALFPRAGLKSSLGKNLDKFLEDGEDKRFTRVILDTHLRIPPGSAIAGTSDRIRTVVFAGRVNKKRPRGETFMNIEHSASGKWRPADVLKVLYRKYGITSVLLEAGPAVLTSFLTSGLIDKFKVFIAPLIIGGGSGYGMFGDTGAKNIPDSIRLRFASFKRSGQDILITAYPITERGQ